MSSPTILKALFPKGSVTDEDKLAEEQKMKAMIFLLGADPPRYSSLLRTLEDGLHLGRDEYPTSVAATFELLQKTSTTSKTSRFLNRFRRNNKFRVGNVSFAQVNTDILVPGTDG